MVRGVSKLAPEDYAEMRRLYHTEHWSQGRIARRYDMSTVQVGRIVRGESQRSAPNPDPPVTHVASAETITASQKKLFELLEAGEKEIKFNDPLKDKLKPYA